MFYSGFMNREPDPRSEDAAVAAASWVPPVLDAVDLVVETEAVMSMLAAQQYQRIDAMRHEALQDAQRHGHLLTEVIERSVRLELAAAMRITEAAAGRLIAEAAALVDRFPAVLDSLAGARMTRRHASLLCEAMDAVEAEFLIDLLPRAIALAEQLPVGSFRRRLRLLIESARATTLAERHERAIRGRRVVVEDAEDGMAWLHALLPATEAHAGHGRLTAMAKVLDAQPDEDRTLDQLRADVFCDLLIDGVTDALPADARGIRATVAVTVPVLALLGGSESGHAMVEGVGPIPMARARELCGGADGWMRVLTHPETGMVLSVGRDQYRPPPALRRLVKWRSEVCMAPGCNMPASRCQIDHNIAWEHGGTTSLQNLTPLCLGHHILKHHGRWRVRQLPDTGGVIEWTSPTGRRYAVEPTRRVPVFRAGSADDAPF